MSYIIVFSTAASMHNDDDSSSPCAYGNGNYDAFSYGPAFGLMVSAAVFLTASIAFDIKSIPENSGGSYEA